MNKLYFWPWVIVLKQKLKNMKNLKLKVALIALLALSHFMMPTETLAQPRYSQGQHYNQGFDDAYGQRGGNRHRGRMHRRYAPRHRFIAPPPPHVRHRRMVRRMAFRHHYGWCATAPRPRRGCR
jgi:hypothetical protein